MNTCHPQVFTKYLEYARHCSRCCYQSQEPIRGLIFRQQDSFPPHHVRASHAALCMLGAHKSSKQLCKDFSGLMPSILELLNKMWGDCPWKLVASQKRCGFTWQAGPNTHLFQLRKLEALVGGSLLASTGLKTAMLATLALGQQKVLGTYKMELYEFAQAANAAIEPDVLK